MDEQIETILQNAEHAGDIHTAVIAERERCERIVMAARLGEIDQDFRSVWHYVHSGNPFPEA